jgi:hypothetical protein
MVWPSVGAERTNAGGSVSRMYVTIGDASDSMPASMIVAVKSLRPGVRSTGTISRIVDPTGASAIAAGATPSRAR